jgi:hypothetical protein
MNTNITHPVPENRFGVQAIHCQGEPPGDTELEAFMERSLSVVHEAIVQYTKIVKTPPIESDPLFD